MHVGVYSIYVQVYITTWHSECYKNMQLVISPLIVRCGKEVSCFFDHQTCMGKNMRHKNRRDGRLIEIERDREEWRESEMVGGVTWLCLSNCVSLL